MHSVLDGVEFLDGGTGIAAREKHPQTRLVRMSRLCAAYPHSWHTSIASTVFLSSFDLRAQQIVTTLGIGPFFKCLFRQRLAFGGLT